MTDVFDRAQAIDLAEWESRNLHREQRPTDWERLSLKWCAGCGLRIPDERRRAVPGTQLCVHCQADAEHNYQQHGNRR